MQFRGTKKSDVKRTYLPYDILILEPICMMGKESLGLRLSRSQKHQGGVFSNSVLSEQTRSKGTIS